jgi:hypothetical protein
MKVLPVLAWLAAIAALLLPPEARAQNRAKYEGMVTIHARANDVPESLVHRVIVRESKYHPDLIGRGGTIGLMQIKLATARGLGYGGDEAGLRHPDTNLAYGIKYLAGAWRAANRDPNLAVRYYASGYYYAAKRQRLEASRQTSPILASAPPKIIEPPPESAAEPVTESAVEPATKPVEQAPAPAATAPAERAATPAALKPRQAVPTPRPPPARTAAQPKPRPKKLAEAKAQVPRPPAAIPGGARGTKPR